MTEILIAASNTTLSFKKNGSVGNLVEGVEVEVRDREGNAITRGETGALYVKTPFAFHGYLNKDISEINSPITDDGWFNTGDYGYLDESGSLFITGRLKDLIIHGGINISPASVENLLMEHPDIQEAVVIGKPHHFWGEEVVAFIKTKNDINESETKSQEIKESLDKYCKENLELGAIPASYKLVKDFPRSSTGKVKKHLLREML
jgi:acyl-CoA synthetase (AMP-forming)/AMP-acid ligase II